MSKFFEIDTSGLDIARGLLFNIEGGFQKANSRAINRTLIGVRQQLINQATNRYYVKSNMLRKSIGITKANSTNQVGQIKSNGKAIALSKFKINPNEPKYMKKGSLVHAAIKKSNGMKPIHSFVQRLSNGYVGVFYRVAGHQYPIKQNYSLSEPSMLNQTSQTKSLQVYVDARFSKEITNQVKLLLSQKGKV